MIPYGRQWIDEEDIQAVVDVLRSDWLTTGPVVKEFERAIAAKTGTRHAVVVSSGTAALHAIMYGLGIGLGDEVIVPAMTFAATANVVVYQGGIPVFADVKQEDLLLDASEVVAKINPRTKAIVAVDYAGQPADYDALRQVALNGSLFLVADACHALGAKYKGVSVGYLADATAFSFHPVKHVTTGEGGAVCTNDPVMYARMNAFRNHGITTDHKQRMDAGSWYYEMTDLGYNYRLTDFQCALGLSQLKKLDSWIARRRQIADMYTAALAGIVGVEPLGTSPDGVHSYHLYVVRIKAEKLGFGRDYVFRQLREQGIGVNVHYIPVHLHPFYRKRFGTGPGLCPVAEKAYDEILSLPMFPRMTDQDVQEVIVALSKVLKR
ncbi:UDP-4-amino-4,6-dideoxy-N-acetyl-beta-L-altrosamine transaminase [Desulfomonile tiedjei]|uniref:UDP-4-keto-6-deoxy-N-acetylglucosamine 4-aminotransferase n=1 Tax=Desulfomonile tiedjei (strain ATCC 49306 / DSM 6799 / DCB-1) TaxID=706587 RepID=I4C7F6_DESTA|nr:UDP-4-amino-4,6-dideoxy-N-acetyl-beta-L-altrosamine transaminase [Desulfomonile tiedjei]AFM25497.1 UDP-4-keto-6-deoxy-N-acetylglucosamine 4-aminotransferase [Desulfomonile tiedjei DSM 6799]